MEFGPVASPLGLVLIAIGIWLAIKAVKTVVKVGMVVVIAIGAYLFFFGGTLPAG